MQSRRLQQLVYFLRNELEIPSASIELAIRQHSELPNIVPIVLWQYGLITLEQLDVIFDWLETA
jgi:hypothetical protein